jgi:hypothetical protein
MKESTVNRLITMVVVIAVVVIALIAGAGLLIAHNIAARQAPPPGPSGYARSTAVRTADEAAASWQDQEFAALSRLAPWLRQAGRSVIDACSGSGGTSGLFGGGSELAYSCQRTDTRYYGYGGTAIAGFDAVLTRLGWDDFTYMPTGLRLPEVTAEPSTLAGSAGSAESIGKIGLEYSVAGPGSELVLDQQPGAVPQVLPTREQYYLQVVRSSARSILAHLTPADNQVLIVSLMEYYAQSVP